MKPCSDADGLLARGSCQPMRKQWGRMADLNQPFTPRVLVLGTRRPLSENTTQLCVAAGYVRVIDAMG